MRCVAVTACMVGLGLGLAACGGGDDGPPSPGGGPPLQATVSTGPGNAFNPPSVTIKVGGTVTWQLPAAHNADFEDGTVEDLAFGESASRTFAAAGTYRFRCDAHSTSFASGMTGAVTVAP